MTAKRFADTASVSPGGKRPCRGHSVSPDVEIQVDDDQQRPESACSDPPSCPAMFCPIAGPSHSHSRRTHLASSASFATCSFSFSAPFSAQAVIFDARVCAYQSNQRAENSSQRWPLPSVEEIGTGVNLLDLASGSPCPTPSASASAFRSHLAGPGAPPPFPLPPLPSVHKFPILDLSYSPPTLNSLLSRPPSLNLAPSIDPLGVGHEMSSRGFDSMSSMGLGLSALELSSDTDTNADDALTTASMDSASEAALWEAASFLLTPPRARRRAMSAPMRPGGSWEWDRRAWEVVEE